MIEPVLNSGTAWRWDPASQASPPDSLPEWPPAETALPRARLETRRIRFFRDLVTAGYHHALSPDPQSRTLRSERIALGIDLPELDTVPLWSIRREDGTVSIPFIEFLLGQICSGIDCICSQPALVERDARGALAPVRRALALVLRETSPEGEAAPALPRLGDIYISEELLKELCGEDGVLDLVVRRCEALVADSY